MSFRRKSVKRCIRLLMWLIFLSSSVTIFGFSHQTAEQSTKVSQTVLHEVLKKTVPDYKEMTEPEQKQMINVYDFAIRKAAHFGIYTVWGLTFSILLSLYEQTLKTIAMMVACGGFFYACSDEIHQKFMTGRAAQLTDILIDSVGAVLGFVIFLFFWRIGKHFLNYLKKSLDGRRII